MQSDLRSRQVMSAEHSGLDGPSAHFLALGDPTKKVAWASSFGYHLGIDSDRPLVEGDSSNDKRLIRKMAKKKTKRLVKALHQEGKEDKIPLYEAFNLWRTTSGEISLHNVHSLNTAEDQINGDLLVRRVYTSDRQGFRNSTIRKDMQEKTASLKNPGFEPLRGRDDATSKQLTMGYQILANVEDAMDSRIPENL
ncbi:hypothetical protein FMUND_9332 [Fusarium mundagurra]|uniref:Uncharacterized protein n=1 Tax=Fusarium mundagurra TaxID=1567541 RepID=A0A8H5YFW6_9HYPO|nr:hypothetical protein FMUND_9332 [Fusarium mundagurra]